MRISLRERLLAYINKLEVPVASGELQRIVMLHTTYTPRTTVRRLEELAEEGLISVEYRKGHAWYLKKLSTQTAEEWFDSIPAVNHN